MEVYQHVAAVTIVHDSNQPTHWRDSPLLVDLQQVGRLSNRGNGCDGDGAMAIVEAMYDQRIF